MALLDLGFLLARRDILAFLVQGQVFLGDRKFALQQPFVDRAELADAQAAEIDRAKDALAFGVGSTSRSHSTGPKSLFGKRDVGQQAAGGRNGRFLGEHAAVVGRHAPFLRLAGVDHAEQPHHFVPVRACCRRIRERGHPARTLTVETPAVRRAAISRAFFLSDRSR